MSTFISKKKVAVVGDEAFVKGFRLGGARAGYVVEQTNEYLLHEKVKEVMGRIYEDPSIGVVIIQDNLRKAVESLRKASMYPLIIYVPNARTAGEMDVKAYYASLIRSYLGISLEV